MEHISSNQDDNRAYIPWNYPTSPSRRARQLIEQLNRLGREQFNTCGPSVEYRDGLYWIDICYHKMSDSGKLIKFAIEIDDEHHDDPIQKEKDWKKDEYLRSKGWIIKRVHHSDFDARDVSDLAWDFLFELSLLQCDSPSLTKKYS